MVDSRMSYIYPFYWLESCLLYETQLSYTSNILPCHLSGPGDCTV